ncbi:Immunogenic protein [Moritella viscosa]|uniref:TAXI family TRAP transporter solute-binding subunit n=1 Tax=Moritella viscosa TaxID=80854 RepID=UPI000915425B|nr:TAXI family TRAP transporter solute-binding subunit [Moritella viscosa]SGZ08851.1 Immunogenic protein [Moritella viscosa]
MATTSAIAEEKRSYILATASTGGTYYPVGVALATLSKIKLEPKYGFSLAAISSAGSGENIKLLSDDEAQPFR